MTIKYRAVGTFCRVREILLKIRKIKIIEIDIKLSKRLTVFIIYVTVVTSIIASMIHEEKEAGVDRHVKFTLE